MIKHFNFDDNTKALLSETASMAELMEEIRLEWCKHYLQNSLEADQISQCIMQMMTLKIQSVLRLCEGVPLPGYQPQPIFLDTASIVALLRCIYEEVFIFHNIFATERGVEKLVLINIWKIKGLSNQIYEKSRDDEQQNVFPEEVYKHSEETKSEIEKIGQETENLLKRMNVSDDVKKSIHSNMKPDRSIKGYKFVRKDNKIVKFEQVMFASSPEEVFGSKKLNPLYRLLSVHSHPTSLGIMEFGTMYNRGVDIYLLEVALKGICIMSAIFIKDFLKSIQNGELIENRLSDNSRKRIDLYSQVG